MGRKESNAHWHDIETILENHGVPKDEDTAYNEGDRDKGVIEAIIADMRDLNA